MVEIWYTILAVMLTLYAVLDGFDLGAGIVYPWLAKSDIDRQKIRDAIGPFFSGNEVWLIAFGGALFLAFPLLLGRVLSGFYLPVFLLLWLFAGRGLALELAHEWSNRLWLQFWDAALFLSSALLALLQGVAIGNILRGVPIEDTGNFSLPLFTSFRTHGAVGAIDWFTLLCGLWTMAAFAIQGALFLAWRNHDDSELVDRSKRVARTLGMVEIVLMATVFATLLIVVRPELKAALAARPLVWLTIGLALGSVLPLWVRTANPLTYFLSYSIHLGSVLLGTAALIFPIALRSTSLVPSLELRQAASQPYNLKIGLIWWSLGFVLVVVYYTVLFRIHRARKNSAS